MMERLAWLTMSLLVAMVTTVVAEEPVVFVCYVCSYTRSTDPSVDYGCVTEPWNVTKGLTTISCRGPSTCITRAQYNQDMSHIRSVTRGCLPLHELCAGLDCCNRAGTYPECEFKCREDLCNDDNPARRLKTPTTGPGDNSDNPDNGAAAILNSALIYVPSIISVTVLVLNNIY